MPAGTISVGGCRDDNLDPKMTSTGQLNRVGGPGGSFYDVGNVYSASLSSASSAVVTNWGTWGIENDVIAPSAYGLVFELSSHSDPGLRTRKVSHFSATIPSFLHSATDPNETGVNRLTLSGEYNNEGEIDTATGDFTLRLHATLTNAYYGSEDPATVVLDCTGHVDVVSGTISVEISGFAYDPNQ